MRILTTLPLFLLLACDPGALRAPEVDDLSDIDSAEWIEWHRERSGEDEVWHQFVLSSYGPLCGDLQETVPELADLYADLLDDLDNADTQTDECNALENFYDDAAELTEKMYRKPVTTLALTLRDPDDDRDDPPPEDIYDQGVDDKDPWFLGSLVVTEANPYAELAEVANDCPDNLDDALEDALSDNQVRYEVDRGEVEALERDDAYRLDLEGEIEDDDGDDAGDLKARGTFRHCEVSWNGFFDPYDPADRP